MNPHPKKAVKDKHLAKGKNTKQKHRLCEAF